MLRNVLLIWDRIGHYHNARWEALEKKLSDNHVFCADFGQNDAIYKWQGDWTQKKNYRLLSEKPVEEKDVFNRIRNYLGIIRQQKIKMVCIPGYGRIEYVLMIALSQLIGLKVVLFAESWYKRSKMTDRLKGLFLNVFCDVFFVSGIRAKKHFMNNLKVSGKKIRTGYSVVDNQHFQRKAHTHKKRDKIILCIARFSEEKNLTTLIDAYKNSEIRKTYKLQLVGGGTLKKQLHKEAQGCETIELTDWVSYNELPELYQKATVFVLPSIFEPWGLVVNEAMAAGLPVIASQQCGCVPDLIDCDNGFVFNAKNKTELSLLFDNLIALSEYEIKQMGEVSIKKIRMLDVESWSEMVAGLCNK